MSDATPEADEIPLCPVCDSNDGGIEVGTRGRFGMPVRNIACHVCGLVYQSPRPTRAAMAEYYAKGYREHYGEVGYPTADGGYARPADPGYQTALENWHSVQAANARALGATQTGERVLEVGCRHGRTLSILQQTLGIEAFGIEPGIAESERARAAGVACFTGTLEDFAPNGLRFDQIQSFHVLEHLHDPLAALIRWRSWLMPAGRVVIEVPNVYQPYGLLEENFFQNAHLTNFSAETLTALLLRAGFLVRSTVDRGTLFAVATPDFQAGELPRPFERSPSAHSAVWVAERLRNYAELEKLRLEIKQHGPSMDALNATLAVLKKPGFAAHSVNTVTELVDYFIQRQAPRAAMVIAAAAACSEHPADVRAGFEKLALALQAVARVPAPGSQAEQAAGPEGRAGSSTSGMVGAGGFEPPTP